MSRLKIQYKTIVWQEIDLFEEDVQKVIQSLENNPQVPPWELFEITQCETLYDTEELMTVEENDNQETIELYKDGEIIWTNLDK